MPAGQLLPDLAQYEQLIGEGTAAADAQDCPVDHVTARRLAIWLAAQPQQPSLAQGLARFINTGAIQPKLKNQLRIHARSGTHADHAQAARLLRYCAARGTDLGPVGDNFGAACHQLDRSDLMLTGTRYQAWHGTSRPSREARPDTDGPPLTALARHDPDSQTVTLVLDAATANIAIYAITAHAQEREAHLREVQLHAQDLPEGSYGRLNRQAIADRETRITTLAVALWNGPTVLRQFLAVVATPDMFGSCDGTAGTRGAAAGREAGAVCAADRAGIQQLGGVPDRRDQPADRETVATRPHDHDPGRPEAALCSRGRRRGGQACQGDLGPVPV